MDSDKEEMTEFTIANEIFCFWFTSTLQKGCKNRLKLNDLRLLPTTMRCDYTSTLKTDEYENHLKECHKCNLSYSTDELSCIKNQRIKYIHFIQILLKSHWCSFVTLGILKLLCTMTSFAGPVLLGYMVTYVSTIHSIDDLNYGIFLALILTVSVLVSAGLNTLYNIHGHILYMKLKSTMLKLLFSKLFKLKAYECHSMEFNESKVTTLLQVDINVIASCLKSIHDIWSLPLQLIIAFILLYLQVRIGFLAGIVVILILIPINSYIAKHINIATTHMLAAKDDRINILNDAIKNMKSIKMLNLISYILNKNNIYRQQEMKYLSYRKYLDALCVFLWACTPLLVPVITFITTVYVNAPLTPAQIFTALALLAMLTFPINAFPWVINGLIEARVSIIRLSHIIMLSHTNNTHTTTTDSTTTTSIAAHQDNSNMIGNNKSIQSTYSVQRSLPSTPIRMKSSTTTTTTTVDDKYLTTPIRMTPNNRMNITPTTTPTTLLPHSTTNNRTTPVHAMKDITTTTPTTNTTTLLPHSTTNNRTTPVHAMKDIITTTPTTNTTNTDGDGVDMIAYTHLSSNYTSINNTPLKHTDISTMINNTTTTQSSLRRELLLTVHNMTWTHTDPLLKNYHRYITKNNILIDSKKESVETKSTCTLFSSCVRHSILRTFHCITCTGCCQQKSNTSSNNTDLNEPLLTSSDDPVLSTTLNLEENNTNSNSSNRSNNNTVAMKDAHIYTIGPLSLQVYEDQIHVITGTIGSGKSTLLQALLSELYSSTTTTTTNIINSMESTNSAESGVQVPKNRTLSHSPISMFKNKRSQVGSVDSSSSSRASRQASIDHPYSSLTTAADIDIEKNILSTHTHTQSDSYIQYGNTSLQHHYLTSSIRQYCYISYCEQIPFIHSGSMYDNILMGRIYDSSRYHMILEGCQLLVDIQALSTCTSSSSYGSTTTPTATANNNNSCSNSSSDNASINTTNTYTASTNVNKNGTNIPLDIQVGENGNKLSGGQRLRVGIARALYSESKIVLLDDPFSALDRDTSYRLFQFIQRICHQEKRAFIIVSHYTPLLQIADNIILMHHGTIVTQGTFSELSSHSSDYFHPTAMHSSETTLYSEVDNNIKVLTMEESKGRYDEIDTLKMHSEKIVIPTTTSDTAAVVSSNTKDTMVNTNMDQNNIVVISDEDKDDFEYLEQGYINSAVYYTYFKSAGIGVTFCVLLVTILMQVSSTCMALWWSMWANHLTTYSKQYFLYVTLTLLGINIIFATLRSFLFAYAGLKATTALYQQLIQAVFYTRISFFESTSVGSIINRFGKDTHCVDDQLPFIMNIVLAQIFLLTGSFTIMIYTVPMVSVVIIIVGILYYRLQLFYRATSRMLRRLESMYQSPIYSLMNECYQNAICIRALSEVSIQYFQKKLYKAIDDSIRVHLNSCIASQWLSMRLQLMGCTITFALCLIAILSSIFHLVPVNPSLIGLSITYSLSIVNNLNGLVNSLAETEQEMISVERIRQYLVLDKEEDMEIDSIIKPRNKNKKRKYQQIRDSKRRRMKASWCDRINYYCQCNIFGRSRNKYNRIKKKKSTFLTTSNTLSFIPFSFLSTRQSSTTAATAATSMRKPKTGMMTSAGPTTTSIYLSRRHHKQWKRFYSHSDESSSTTSPILPTKVTTTGNKQNKSTNSKNNTNSNTNNHIPHIKSPFHSIDKDIEKSLIHDILHPPQYTEEDDEDDDYNNDDNNDDNYNEVDYKYMKEEANDDNNDCDSSSADNDDDDDCSEDEDEDENDIGDLEKALYTNPSRILSTYTQGYDVDEEYDESAINKRKQYLLLEKQGMLSHHHTKITTTTTTTNNNNNNNNNNGKSSNGSSGNKVDGDQYESLNDLLLTTNPSMTSTTQLVNRNHKKQLCQHKRLWPTKGIIELKNIHMKYSDHLPYALHNLSLTINSGDRVAIVGRTGSGKSSLLRMLLRLNTYEGDVYIDQQNIKNIPLYDYRKVITVIPQDPCIFNDTIRVNLDPLGLYNDEQVLQALLACKFIDTLSDSYFHSHGLTSIITTTTVSKNDNIHVCQQTLSSISDVDRISIKTLQYILNWKLNTTSSDDLSYGQKQLLSLGRAMLALLPPSHNNSNASAIMTSRSKRVIQSTTMTAISNSSGSVSARAAKILLIDEATASIDDKTEHLLVTAMREFLNITIPSVTTTTATTNAKADIGTIIGSNRDSNSDSNSIDNPPLFSALKTSSSNNNNNISSSNNCVTDTIIKPIVTVLMICHKSGGLRTLCNKEIKLHHGQIEHYIDI